MIDADKYEGHAEGPWDIIECSTTGKIWITDGEEDTAWTSVAEVDNHKNMNLIADAPLLLAEVKRLREVIELIGHNMAYDPWMHTLIKEAIGYEKWQAKEMIE